MKGMYFPNCGKTRRRPNPIASARQSPRKQPATVKRAETEYSAVNMALKSTSGSITLQTMFLNALIPSVPNQPR